MDIGLPYFSTIEFRAFNSGDTVSKGTIHAGKIKAYIQFCMAITAQAYNQKYASPTKTVSENEKYTFRVWLLRLGMIGDEFKTARTHLLGHLEGNIAWKDPAQAVAQRERLRKKHEEELTEEQNNVYQLVQEAHDRAIDIVREGVTAAEVDRCARNVFGKKYEKYFSHGTGHGVGLEVHEAPRLSPVSRDILKAQMVVTVEPGLYFPGRWGIRIEDTVLVKKNSCEKLTKMDKRLTIIE